MRRLINSIVLEEESDMDMNGVPSSHFEMYLDAMKQCKANTNNIETFISQVSSNYIPSVSKGVDDFLNTTFKVIESSQSHKIAAAFTFGREDLIPDMFTAIVKEYNSENNLSKFLFTDINHKKLYSKKVYRIVNYYISKVSSLKKKSPHILRHSFATHMLNNGADINAIKELLGHANLSATQIYTHNSIAKLKSVHNQAHPKG